MNTIKQLTTKIQTPTQSRIMSGSKLGRKFDIDGEEDRGRKKMQHIAMKKEDKKKRTTYLLGPESETSPAPPKSSSSEPARSACWSTSSTGGTEALQTPGGSSGRGEGDKGSQDNLKGTSLFSPLYELNCQTAAYIFMANFVKGTLNSGEGKTTALPDNGPTDQWEGRTCCNLNTAASLDIQHQCHDGCNSQGGLQQEQQQNTQIGSPLQPEEVTRTHDMIF
jgi:hypothetical protein